MEEQGFLEDSRIHQSVHCVRLQLDRRSEEVLEQALLARLGEVDDGLAGRGVAVRRRGRASQQELVRRMKESQETYR